MSDAEIAKMRNAGMATGTVKLINMCRDGAARIEALEAENKRMRDALMPFAKAADGRRSKKIKGAFCFGQAHLLSARAALAEQEAGNG